jgi:hypothetical protein
MKQRTLTEFEKYRQTTRHGQFLSDTDRIAPRIEHVVVVDPVYPKGSVAGGRARNRTRGVSAKTRVVAEFS